MIALLLLLGQVVQESGGIVVVEVESAPLAGSWVKETAVAGHTGSGYYRWNGADAFNNPGQGVLSWTVNIGNPGTYHLRIRNHHDHADSTLENDCFTKMDGGAWIKTYSSTANQWTWHSRHEVGTVHSDPTYTLAAGQHTFQISGRSKNFRIDRFHLYLSNVANPTDPSRPPSQTTTGGPAPSPAPVPAPAPAPAPAPGPPAAPDTRDAPNGSACSGSATAAPGLAGGLLGALLAAVGLRRRR